jgi:hypothetical protein
MMKLLEEHWEEINYFIYIRKHIQDMYLRTPLYYNDDKYGSSRK